MDAVSLMLLVFAVVLVITAVKIIPQGMEYTVERFGKYITTLKPGFHLVIPFIDIIGQRISVREQVLDVPSQEVITKDNATITVDGVVFYQVLDIAKAAYEVEHLQFAILNLVMTNIRTVMGGMDLDELLSQRDKINNKLLTVVDEATNPWGVKVNRIEIKDISPPQDLVESMARQMKAERDKRASILEAEGVRQSEILKAEGEKQAQILEAEGRKEAAYREAEAREREAEAEANATRMVSEAISKGDVNSLNYFIGLKYVEALKELAASENQKTLILPIETTSVIGSVAGISEIVKESFSKNCEVKKGEVSPWEK